MTVAPDATAPPPMITVAPEATAPLPSITVAPDASQAAPAASQAAPAVSEPTLKKPRKRRGHKARLKTKFSFRDGDVEYAAVPIPRHKNIKAFKQYATKKDYPEEIVQAMGTSSTGDMKPDPKLGAKRILEQMVEKYEVEFMQVAEENGLNLGVMDALSLAAWQEDTGLKDYQMVKSLKHLRHNLKGKVAVPFYHTKKCSEGYVDPKVKQFDHQYEKSGEVVPIPCWYQDVDKMTEALVAEKLTELKVKPKEVKEIDFVFGGDHGKEAF